MESLYHTRALVLRRLERLFSSSCRSIALVYDRLKCLHYQVSKVSLGCFLPSVSDHLFNVNIISLMTKSNAYPLDLSWPCPLENTLAFSQRNGKFPSYVCPENLIFHSLQVWTTLSGLVRRSDIPSVRTSGTHVRHEPISVLNLFDARS